MNSFVTTSPIEDLPTCGKRLFFADLASLRRYDSALTGAKAATLGELRAFGFNVPEGIVVTTAGYRSFVEHEAVREWLRLASTEMASANAAQLADMSAEITDVFLGSPLPAWALAIVDWASVSGSTVAVRSSATNEDLLGATFAGQYDSFLNVTAAAIPDAIKRCFASLYNARAILYRRRKAIPRVGEMGVILQRMIQAEAAGVVYTRAPWREHDVLVEIAAGAGDRVVSGSVAPNRYYIDRGTLAVGESTIPDPRLAPDLDGIARCALAAEAALGYTVDLEFAVESGSVYTLQARPAVGGPVEQHSAAC